LHRQPAELLTFRNKEKNRPQWRSRRRFERQNPSTCEPFEARLRPKNRSEIRVFSMCALPPSRSESFGVRGRSQLGRTRLVAIARMKAIR
jgi:hypothetical protein